MVLLANHYKVVGNAIAPRHLFRRWSQRSGEVVDDYALERRSLVLSDGWLLIRVPDEVANIHKSWKTVEFGNVSPRHAGNA